MVFFTQLKQHTSFEFNNNNNYIQFYRNLNLEKKKEKKERIFSVYIHKKG